MLPFYNPAALTPTLVFSALSLAVLSFLGFDAISTMSEESRDGAGAIGRATILSLCLSAALFVAQTYVAALFAQGRTGFPPGDQTDAAFYNIAAMIGGTLWTDDRRLLRALGDRLPFVQPIEKYQLDQ